MAEGTFPEEFLGHNLEIFEHSNSSSSDASSNDHDALPGMQCVDFAGGIQHSYGPQMQPALIFKLPIEDIMAIDEDLANTVEDTVDEPAEQDKGQQSWDVITARTRPTQQHQERVKKNGNWIDEDLQQVLAAIDNNMNILKANKTFHIPYSSLQEWCYGQRTSRKRGSRGVLTVEEEQLLVDWLLRICKMEHGLSLTTLKLKVYEITKSRWTLF